jgi:predicted small metal-binding protein
MAKVLRCGDLMPGCNAVIEGKDEAEVMAKAEHAKAAHKMTAIPPDIAAKVKAASRTRSSPCNPNSQLALTGLESPSALVVSETSSGARRSRSEHSTRTGSTGRSGESGAPLIPATLHDVRPKTCSPAGGRVGSP